MILSETLAFAIAEAGVSLRHWARDVPPQRITILYPTPEGVQNGECRMAGV